MRVDVVLFQIVIRKKDPERVKCFEFNSAPSKCWGGLVLLLLQVIVFRVRHGTKPVH